MMETIFHNGKGTSGETWLLRNYIEAASMYRPQAALLELCVCRRKTEQGCCLEHLKLET